MNEELKTAQLQQKVQIAGLFREWCQHPAFKIWEKELNDKISDTKNEWLTADDVKAAKLRLRGVYLMEALDIVKKRILEGDNARKMLDAFQSTGLADSEQPINRG